MPRMRWLEEDPEPLGSSFYVMERLEGQVPTDRPPKEVLELLTGRQKGEALDEPFEWRLERGLRALGTLGGQGATEAVLEVLGTAPPEEAASRPMVRAGIRSLGRLRDERAFDALIGYLDNTMWARAAADALGDFGDRRAVGPLSQPPKTYTIRMRTPVQRLATTVSGII